MVGSTVIYGQSIGSTADERMFICSHLTTLGALATYDHSRGRLGCMTTLEALGTYDHSRGWLGCMTTLGALVIR